MAFSTVVDEMMDFYGNSMKSYCDGCLDVHQQVLDCINDLLPGSSVFHTEQGDLLHQEWTKTFGSIISAMQKMHADLLEEMKPDRIFKTNIEDMRRQFGLASLEETGILLDQVDNLKAQIADLRSQNRIGEIVHELERNGRFAAQDDLRPLKESLSDLNRRIESVGDVDSLQETVSHLENDLSNYMDEITQIKQLVAKINPKISILGDAIERLSGRMGTSEPISME